jgi:hypothetical protein
MMRPGRDSSDVAGGRRRQDFFEVPRFDVPFFEVLYAEGPPSPDDGDFLCRGPAGWRELTAGVYCLQRGQASKRGVPTVADPPR